MRAPTTYFALPLLLGYASSLPAQGDMPHEHGMRIGATGAVMNENRATLPRGCEEISRDYKVTVRAGKDYAAELPGQIFGMSEPEIIVAPCGRIEITFINEDSVRHQWMVHGLPRYLYPAGMFHIEAEGAQSQVGTLIVPAGDQTYLIHCDLAQHMEKGMRGQLVVGQGSGDLWNVPGVSDRLRRDSYLPSVWPLGVDIIAGLLGVALALLLSWRLRRHG
jgi:FtsP/CotA-like multicopper oxidase with cupredoxin domain